MPQDQSITSEHRGVMGCGLLLAYLLLVVLRVPETLYPGRFWAEEGALYFHDAYTTGALQFITTPVLGYYSLVTKLACLAASHSVALDYAPLVTAFFALFVQALPAFLIISSRIPALPNWPSRIAAVLLILLVQPNQEVWINTVNSQFFLCVATGIIMISEPCGRTTHCVRLSVLFVAGLTGVVSCILLPFFAIEYAVSRKTTRLHEALTLGSASALQLLAVMSFPMRAGESLGDVLPFVLLIKQWILPLFGTSAANWVAEFIKSAHVYPTDGLGAMCALTPHIAVFICLILWGRREILLLFVGASLIASISFFKSVESQSADAIQAHISAFSASRYYYAPNVLLGLTLLARPRTMRGVGLRHLQIKRLNYDTVGNLWRALCLTLVALMLGTGTIDYFSAPEKHAWFFSGPQWSTEVEQWRKGNAEMLHIWPKPWVMVLPHENRNSALKNKIQHEENPIQDNFR
jgi:hypothetical protein